MDKTLEPNTYHEVNINLKTSKKMPRAKYFIKAVIETTHKDYIHYIPMVFYDDMAKELYDFMDKENKEFPD